MINVYDYFQHGSLVHQEEKQKKDEKDSCSCY